MCRKAAETPDGGEIEVWGSGMQTRSFLYVDECVEAVLRLMESDFVGPVNIGSEEMVTINQLAGMAIAISGKEINIKNIEGKEFVDKYGFKCPLGVQGRNSDNKLYKNKVGWEVSQPLSIGLKKTYQWIKSQVDYKEKNTSWIFESPDGGQTVYKRESQSSDRHKIK
jgi:nucleoside-diphosphate-sugar epimerase